jgi:hypothetical protein
MADVESTAAAEVAVSEDTPEKESRRSQWARRYPPLLSILVALVIVFAVLPSSLNLPQTNPTQTLEYAPVPPDKKDPTPPQQGNLSSLGLAGSASIEGDGAVGGAVGGLIGNKKNPSNYRCVGNPPRQTEDPLSPPCVAYFQGDNFGATYQGVTGDEIRIVIYTDGNIADIGTSRGTENRPSNLLVDLVNDPPKQEDHQIVRVARLWQYYFNNRFQTYGRYAHFFVYFGSNSNTVTPETRRADAAEVYRRVKPFATIDQTSFGGGGDAFIDTLARRGVLNFGSFVGQDASFFQKYPKLIWGFPPSMEIQADEFAKVLCNKYVGKPVDHSTNLNGRPRKFGLVFTTDPGYDNLRRLKDSVMDRFRQCGGTLATSPRTFPTAGYTADTSTSPRYALEAMQAFQQAGVTTVIWPGGLETNFSKAAAELNYHPEWIVDGDGLTDSFFAQQGYGGSIGQNQSEWADAVVVSYQPQIPSDERTRECFRAQRTVDPNVPQQDALRAGCDMYDSLRQVFIGIQVAGPRLGPTSIDRGFHAIPPLASQSLQVPSCYYNAGDYTCIKDFVLGRWDPQGNTEEQGAGSGSAEAPGCYRIVGARRIASADVDDGNAMAGYNPTEDPCLGYGSSFQSNTNPPNPSDL